MITIQILNGLSSFLNDSIQLWSINLGSLGNSLLQLRIQLALRLLLLRSSRWGCILRNILTRVLNWNYLCLINTSHSDLLSQFITNFLSCFIRTINFTLHRLLGNLLSSSLLIYSLLLIRYLCLVWKLFQSCILLMLIIAHCLWVLEELVTFSGNLLCLIFSWLRMNIAPIILNLLLWSASLYGLFNWAIIITLIW